MTNEKVIYGNTGEIGRDGLLTPDQQQLLNRTQEHAVGSCFTYLQKRQLGDPFPLVAMATGIGKGNIIHRVIERQIRENPYARILVVAGTKNVLVRQTHSALARYQGTTQVYPNIDDDFIDSENIDEEIEETSNVDEYSLQNSVLYRTGELGQKDLNVHIATVQSLQSSLKRGLLQPNNYDLVIVDEVHNIGTKQRMEAIQQFNKAVGFTATPFRHSGKLKAPKQYGFDIVESLSLPEAQELRLLPPLLGIQIDTKEVLDEIPTTKTGAIDYKALENQLKASSDLRPFIADRVARIISSDKRNYKTVIAVNFVWEAEEIAKLLYKKGIKVGVAINQRAAKEIHSDDIPTVDSIERYGFPESDERSLQVLISPYVASEGFDAPFTEVLVWASPTDSALRYTQYTGRLARRAEGKRFGVVIDCLYQTSQYSWSYNMGMWMKGSITQLDNGLLWLGPEAEIKDLNQLDQVRQLQKESQNKTLEELQKEGIIELQESDFAITEPSVLETFSGDTKRVLKEARDLVKQIQEEYPELIANRKKYSRAFTVVTNRQYFIDMMIERGILLKDDPKLVKKDDFVISDSAIRKKFSGGSQRVIVAAREILEQIRKGNPDLVGEKIIHGRTVPVIFDQQYFITLMNQRGFGLKDKENISN